MEALTQAKCVACSKDAPTVTDAEIAEFQPQVSDWDLVELDGIKRLRRVFSFADFAQAMEFTNKVGEARGGRRPSSGAADRMGSDDGHLVDAQDQGSPPQRFRDGGERRTSCSSPPVCCSPRLARRPGTLAWRRAQLTGVSSRTATNWAIAKSRSSVVCAADIWVRMRAFPRGTTG